MKRGPSSPQFLYYGWFCGLVPVYVTNPYKGTPEVEVRWWCPKIALDLVTGFAGFFAPAEADADFDWPVLITGRIHRSAT